MKFNSFSQMPVNIKSQDELIDEELKRLNEQRQRYGSFKKEKAIIEAKKNARRNFEQY